MLTTLLLLIIVPRTLLLYIVYFINPGGKYHFLNGLFFFSLKMLFVCLCVSRMCLRPQRKPGDSLRESFLSVLYQVGPSNGTQPPPLTF